MLRVFEWCLGICNVDFYSAGVSVSAVLKKSSNFFVPSFETFVLICIVSEEISFPLTVFLNLSPFGVLFVLLNFPSLLGLLCIPFS